MRCCLFLQTRRLKLNVKLKDDQEQEMLALDVFAASIRYLKDELLRHMTDAVKNFKPTDIHWVITVPAIWEDSAKQFMREAAIKVYSLIKWQLHATFRHQYTYTSSSHAQAPRGVFCQTFAWAK